MCTVTYFPHANGATITSNRDEHLERPSALPPQRFVAAGRMLFYPKDPKGNGTWFGADDRQNVIVLLNGAAQKHLPQPPYRQSRGLVVLELLQSPAAHTAWEHIDLAGIEPFTLVYYNALTLFQLQWDGLQKTATPLDVSVPHIWSSSTLYPDAVRARRAQWFKDFLSAHHNVLSPDDLMRFHAATHPEDRENGLVIHRNTQVLTKSITQYILSGTESRLMHRDLITGTTDILWLTAN